MADESPDAFAKVVDRLLASPHYGERWGRFWLDTARYADTTGVRNGNNDDYRLPYAWTYRDWVIKAFNDDMPYDQFIMQQLAADKLPNNPAGKSSPRSVSSPSANAFKIKTTSSTTASTP